MGTPEVVVTSRAPSESPPGSACVSARAIAAIVPRRERCLESRASGRARVRREDPLDTPRLQFGVYLNNRGPLLSRESTLEQLLELADAAEAEGFDSLFVGDGLLHEPRHDPLALLGAL